MADDTRKDAPTDKPKKKKKRPKERTVRTTHSVTIDGRAVEYTATAGTLFLRDDEDEPRASIFYVAYTRNDVEDPGGRPITFAFNGGPGSSAVWLQLKIDRFPTFSLAVIWGMIGLAGETVGYSITIATACVLGISALAVVLVRVTT